MKIFNTNITSPQKSNNPAFKGHKAYIDDFGYKQHKFYLPRSSKDFNTEIEIVPLKYDKESGSWIRDTKCARATVREHLPEEGLYIDDSLLFPTEEDAPQSDVPEAVGYRYILTKPNNKTNQFYHLDPGTLTASDSKYSEDKFNVLTKNNRAVITRNGLTKQIMPDIVLPGFKFDKDHNIKFDKDAYLRAYHSVRNHGNKLNGNIAGIVKMLPRMARQGYTKIVGTPFTRDDVSSHLYWTQNVYQVAPNLGTIDDFKYLQTQLFINGINWIADGAFVNQGLQGVQFRDVLKHGQKSPFYHWFKATGLENGPITLGVIPKNAGKYTRFKLVNAEETMSEENGRLVFKRNQNYDKTKPTYLQMYDARLVTEEEVNDTQKIIPFYSKTNTDNSYEITGHDDITQLVSFPINYNKFKFDAVKTFNSITDTSKSLENPETLRHLLKFENFRIGYKDKGGFDLWDGNMDIAKLNFYISNLDQKFIDAVSKRDQEQEIKKYETAVHQVQDYSIQAGKYWTKLTADTQFEYTAKQISGNRNPSVNDYIKLFDERIAKGLLPKTIKETVNEDVINNVLEGFYYSPRLKKTEKLAANIDDFICNEIMNFPLDSLEFGWDLSAVLSSPYISKRAINDSQISLSRYELMQSYEAGYTELDERTEKLYKKTDKLIKNEFTELVKSILVNMNNSLSMGSDRKMFDDAGNVTKYGRYAIPLIMPDLVKYIVAKSFNSHSEIPFCNGKFDYSKADLESVSLTSLKIDGPPEYEAEKVIAKFREGIHDLRRNSSVLDKLSGTFLNRLSKISLIDFQLAEAIMDKTESGLGWRIDAAKDIANIDALRSKNDSPAHAMEEVTKFWGNFNKAVLKENPHAYTTAEITDLTDFIKSRQGQYKNYLDAETKFIEQSGLNNTANYMFFFSMLKNLFSRSAETGAPDNFANIIEFKNKLDGTNKHIWKESEGFLFTYPSDSTTFSYTFLGNHDKPRPLHIFALDMSVFHSQLHTRPDANMNNDARKDLERARNIAAEILHIKPEQVIHAHTSGKAVAMAKRIKDALSTAHNYKYDSKNNLVAIDKKNEESTKEHQKRCVIFEKALKDLASGVFKGKNFNPDVFGSRPIDMAIDDVFTQAKLYYGLKFDSKDEEDELKAIVFEIILKPAMEKFQTTYKMLVTLPGSPTDFIGDKEGSTGYETKSNNDFQQNRNFVHYEWIHKTLYGNYHKVGKGKKFVQDFYVKMTKIGELRKRPELSALCDGTTVSLKLQEGNVYGTFRYNDKGSEVISLYTAEGAAESNDMIMDHPEVKLSKINLSGEGLKQGLTGGLEEGTIYKNANSKDTSIYKVCKDNGEYVIKRFDEKTGEYMPIVIMPEDINTLILYKANRVEYNPTTPLTLQFNKKPIFTTPYGYV